MTKQKTTAKPPVTLTGRTSAGLRSALFDELDGLRNGTVNSTRANAVAKMASTIIESVRMELDVARYAERNKLPADQTAKRLTTDLDLVAQ